MTKPKKILITGVAGFIGFHLAKYLIKKKYQVIGLDNMNNYYDVSLKKNRINILKDNMNNYYDVSLKKIE